MQSKQAFEFKKCSSSKRNIFIQFLNIQFTLGPVNAYHFMAFFYSKASKLLVLPF